MAPQCVLRQVTSKLNFLTAKPLLTFVRPFQQVTGKLNFRQDLIFFAVAVGLDFFVVYLDAVVQVDFYAVCG